MNKVVLIGRVTKDIDLNFAKNSGTAVAKFTLAVNRMKKDDGADFINCIAFGKQAETIAQYVFKGNQFSVVGRIQTGSYDAKDGTKRYTTDVVVEGFDFIQGSKNNEQATNKNFDDMTPVLEEGEIPF